MKEGRMARRSIITRGPAYSKTKTYMKEKEKCKHLCIQSEDQYHAKWYENQSWFDNQKEFSYHRSNVKVPSRWSSPSLLVSPWSICLHPYRMKLRVTFLLYQFLQWSNGNRFLDIQRDTLLLIIDKNSHETKNIWVSFDKRDDVSETPSYTFIVDFSEWLRLLLSLS